MLSVLFSLLAAVLSPVFAIPTQQVPLVVTGSAASDLSTHRPLHGRFLHISDIHPDPFYKVHSSPEGDDACHRGHGSTGAFGAEMTDCDSPISLVNATFQWIEENLKDTVDFVVWTGDSARHDNDEKIPRTEKQIVQLNELLVDKFTEVFGKEDNINDPDPTNDFTIPIVPTFGNNDIMPHNIFMPGPNRWTKRFLDIWKKFIPETQRHTFDRGGWFFVEVIPNNLAVFSLNTLYFFESNSAVDGCADKSEPGYEQMEWLRIQLQFLRKRGMKAIMTGHVPPARTESKMSWDETCWQKYTLWMRQYRDVVVGSAYGHMNIDHFILQDFEDISILKSRGIEGGLTKASLDGEMTAQSRSDYLTELRTSWSRLPGPGDAKDKLMDSSGEMQPAKDKDKKEKFHKKIGGPWGERYSLSLVGPSVVPNYFPTLRVVEYNISGLSTTLIADAQPRYDEVSVDGRDCRTSNNMAETRFDDVETEKKKAKKQKKQKYGNLKNSKFKTPKPPSKSSPPGPAYSPQTLTWLGYTQYFANLTKINGESLLNQKATRGEHGSLQFEVEYDTRIDEIYQMKDLTVRSYIDLAARIGKYKPAKGDRIKEEPILAESTRPEQVAARKMKKRGSCGEVNNNEDGEHFDTEKKNQKKKKKHGKGKKRKAINRVWFTFVDRAFVGTRDDEDLHNRFGQA
ncbi:Endopolyphosphatase [Loxospora ochrophaea]|nr:Endopolyphosphatase [Loxospora ochrophaea]